MPSRGSVVTEATLVAGLDSLSSNGTVGTPSDRHSVLSEFVPIGAVDDSVVGILVQCPRGDLRNAIRNTQRRLGTKANPAASIRRNGRVLDHHLFEQQGIVAVDDCDRVGIGATLSCHGKQHVFGYRYGLFV